MNSSGNFKKTKSLYNLIPIISWSLLGFTPIGYFCYVYMERLWMYAFLALSVAALFLPDSFFWLIRLSTRSSVYHKIGMRVTKKLTQDGDLVNRSMQRRFLHHHSFMTQNTLERQIARSYFYEKTHFAMLAFFLVTVVYALFRNFMVWAFVIMLTNIVFNLYPILLQQYNRLRIQNIVKRQSSS